MNVCTRCGHHSTAHFATDGACTDCECDHYLGLVENLDDKVYHKSKRSLSASSAKVLLGKRSPTSQAALSFGTLGHTVLLEPEKASAYAVLDAKKIGVKADGTPAEVPTMTKAWKDAVAQAERDGLIVVDQVDWDKAHAMADAARSHEAAAEVLAECPGREVSAFAELDPGVIIRGRFDLLGDTLIGDFKTTVDADPDHFGRTAAAFGYHVSAGAYLLLARILGLSADTFKFINVEKEPTPGGNHRVSVTQLDDLFIAEGEKQFLEAVRRWVELGKRVDLPNYPDETVIVGAPYWISED